METNKNTTTVIFLFADESRQKTEAQNPSDALLRDLAHDRGAIGFIVNNKTTMLSPVVTKK